MLARRLRCHDIHNDVPESLQGEHEGGGIVEREIDPIRMNQRVYAVRTRGDLM